MSFVARDFETLAIWLVQQKTDDEASLRTAISRVYYAGHLLAIERLMKKGWEPTGRGDDHMGVIRELRNRKGRHLGEMLRSLLELREHADYHVEAADSIRNKDCPHCKKIRESSNPISAAVNWDHWVEAQAISQRLLPSLERF